MTYCEKLVYPFALDLYGKVANIPKIKQFEKKCGNLWSMR